MSAINFLNELKKTYTGAYAQKWLEEAIKALEQEPCEDCISRSHFDERVRVAGGMVEYEVSDDFKDGVLTVLEMLKTEPSIQPKSKTDVLDKIRAEIENDWQLKKYPSSPFSCGLRRALEILDKYKAERGR